MSNTCSIDDISLQVVRPPDVASLGDLVRRADAVFPVGGRTQLGLGLPPARPGIAADLTALDQVIDYPARDMTITVQAGLSVAKLQQVLATEKQRLPIDVPRPDRATIGGSVAANVSGPRRLGAGTLRDYVIGISTVNDQGEETKAGGRVVKNVAGYDLNKLHTGALGTLGIITQLTLKVRPVPEMQALVALGCDDLTLPRLLDTLHAGRARPTCLDLLDAAARPAVAALAGVALPERSWVLVVGFEDSEAAVNWQLKQMLKDATSVGIAGSQALAGRPAGPLWDALVAYQAEPEAAALFRAGMLPSRVAEYGLRARREGVALHAHAGSGVVRGHLGAGLTKERGVAILNELADLAVAAGGNLIVERCPANWKRDVPMWGRPRGDWPLMRRVKAELDPRGVFNPGRLFP